MSDRTLKQIGSALLTFAVYSFFLNWKVGLLLVVAIGFHEYSHLFAARKMGLQTKGFFLMPFVGGVALVAQRYRTLGEQAFVVLAGPIGGGLLAVATAGLYYLTGQQHAWMAAAAGWMCLLNLFNLLPLSFLDGGQLMGTITFTINRTLGFVCMAVSTVIAAAWLLKMSPVIGMLIVFFGGSSLLMEYRNWKNYREGNYYLCTEDYLNPPTKLAPWQMTLTISAWLLTAGVLLVVNQMMSDNLLTNFPQYFAN